MDELDKKKKETLEKCYLQVNQTFGQIFSDLLPGAAARIQPLEGQDVSEGLEIGVAFNGVWKNSLSELSG
ncbi:nuclear condensin complex subunit, putative, partial [Ichthyophthirius multifiliis]